MNKIFFPFNYGNCPPPDPHPLHSRQKPHGPALNILEVENGWVWIQHKANFPQIVICECIFVH